MEDSLAEKPWLAIVEEGCLVLCAAMMVVASGLSLIRCVEKFLSECVFSAKNVHTKKMLSFSFFSPLSPSCFFFPSFSFGDEFKMMGLVAFSN